MPLKLSEFLGRMPLHSGSQSAGDSPVYRSDRYTRQRRAGFRQLRFLPDLEREFRSSSLVTNIWRVRIAASIALCVVPGFIVLDQWVANDLTPLAGDLVLLLVTVPAMAVPLLVTFAQRLHPHLRAFMFGGMLVCSLSILAAVVIGRQALASFPYEALLLVTLFIYFVSGLLFFETIFIGLVLWAAFVFCGFHFGWSRLAYEAYYMLLANVFSWIGLYLIERQLRQGFLLERELRAHAVLDGLTHVMNRRAFRVHLNNVWRQAQREGQSIGLLLIDLDHFKLINDRHGHPVGDAVLRRVAHVLRAHAGRGLDGVGRYGGDEFIAVWYAPDLAWFDSLVRQLPETLRATALGHAKDARVTVSGGAVLAWPAPELPVKEAVRLADQKLYEVKRSGRDGIALVELRGDPVAGAPSAPAAA